MNTIKKTTLIAVITAMAAIAVPSLASAATWAPINTNKTLTSTSSAVYQTIDPGSNQYGFTCSSSTLGVHVRTPASSTLDITSATFTGCVTNGAVYCGNATVTATGLPWAATTTGSNVTFTEHLRVTEACIPGTTLTVDGPVSSIYNNATHTLSATPAPGMYLNYMGTPIGAIAGGPSRTATWHETTNTLTLN
jgi:hypothetical protein